MNPFSLILGGISNAVSTLGKAWLDNKKAKIEGEYKIQGKVIDGQIDYNTWAQRAGQTSWKDEFLTLWTCAIITLCFVPATQPVMKEGFIFLKEHTPDWLTYCFVGMYVAVYGLKGWKIFKN
ncbi:MAG: hypothetical protein ACXABY_30760 [Candidatus Thorarchaeota archaeon]|jgi:hypothetical protein